MGDLHRAFPGNSSTSRPEAVNSKLASQRANQVARQGLHKLAKGRTPQEAINLGAAFDARISYAAKTGYLILSIEHWLWEPDLIQHWQSYSHFLGQLKNHSRTEDKSYKGKHINSANIALNSLPHAPRSQIKGLASSLDSVSPSTLQLVIAVCAAILPSYKVAGSSNHKIWQATDDKQ